MIAVLNWVSDHYILAPLMVFLIGALIHDCIVAARRPRCGCDENQQEPSEAK